jgi:large repetitive protein
MRNILAAVVALVLVSCGGNEGNNLPSGPECSDGIDNDGDGQIDFPDDLSCVSPAGTSEAGPTHPQCMDGRDNDGDGKIDYPDDPGCYAAGEDDEDDDCPGGMYCPQCSNGVDDDMNGVTDYPNDLGCESAGDTTEFTSNPVACGGGLYIKHLSPTGIDRGMLDTTSISMLASPCGGSGNVPAVAYAFLLTEPKVVVASTDDPGTAVDTVIQIRSADCTNPEAHLACNDNVDTVTKASTVVHSLLPGVYYIIVSGQNAAATGTFTLRVEMLAGEGTPCALQSDCGPGLLCRTPVGSSQQQCAKPVCSDGRDDDGDGRIDFPADPGCTSLTDDSEEDDCPNGPNCPECANGIDDDGDGAIDFPADLTCKAAADASEACVTSEGVELLTQRVTTGNTMGAVNDSMPTCGSSTNHTAPDRHYRVELPATTALTFTTTSSHSRATSLFNSTCTGTPLGCTSGTALNFSNLAAGVYYFVVDGFSTGQGAYTITVDGTIADGASCEGALAQAGALRCGPTSTCKGPAGARTCRLAQCSDGIDNNMDGKIDFPNDPGCSAPNDDSETTVCPGPNCPVCANGIDDDMDGHIDFPMDVSCIAAGGNVEQCTTTEGIATLTQPATSGTTVNASNDIRLPCASSSTTATSKDLFFHFDVPAMSTLRFDLTSSFDAATAVLSSACSLPPLACSDPNTLTMNNVAAGTYFYVVDGWSSGSGTFTINVSGTIQNGASCESALAKSGAITCAPGSACTGPAGARTCQVMP